MVFESLTNKFMYYDETKNLGGYSFVPNTKKLKMTFQHFLELIRGKTDKFYYMQQTLHDKVGKPIAEDFGRFDWDWVLAMHKRFDWGVMKFNTLWVGMAGVVTPAHFDEGNATDDDDIWLVSCV